MARRTLGAMAVLAACSIATRAAAPPVGWWSGWTSFEPRPDGRIVLPIKLDGHDAMALLDSGTSRSVIDKAYAASIGLKAHGDYPNNGATGLQTSGHIDTARIEVGGVVLNKVTLATLDLAGAGGPSRPLILGEEVFNAAVVDIDFAHHRIAFRDPARFAMPPDAIEVPLVRDGDLRLTPVSIEGRPPALFEFDLGAGGTLAVSPAYARERNLLDGRPTSQGTVVGVGGAATETRTILREVIFAGVSFADIDAHFPQTWPSGTFSNRVKGVLGAVILSRFRLIVDYPHDWLYLVPNPDAATRGL